MARSLRLSEVDLRLLHISRMDWQEHPNKRILADFWLDERLAMTAPFRKVQIPDDLSDLGFIPGFE